MSFTLSNLLIYNGPGLSPSRKPRVIDKNGINIGGIKMNNFQKAKAVDFKHMPKLHHASKKLVTGAVLGIVAPAVALIIAKKHAKHENN